MRIALPTVAADQREFSRAISATVTGIVANHLGAGKRGLAVCAPSAGAGASFVAANLAIAISQLGISTLLIDADLQDCGQERYFPTDEPSIGLQQVLRGGAQDADSVTYFDVLPLLSVVHAGGRAADAHELVGGRLFREIVHRSMRNFDCTILDTPPANRSSDARRAAAIVGRAVVVARHRVSYLDDMALLVEQLRQDDVGIIGAVLNAAEGRPGVRPG